MSSLLQRLHVRPWVDGARLAFGRLTQREQAIVLGGAGGVAALVLLSIGLWVSSAISGVETRVRDKTDKLMQVLELQGDYRARLAEREQKMRELGGANVRLVSLVEETARQAGVEIGQLKPEEGEANEDGIAESRVDLRATNLSADRLKDFLERLENARGLVIVRRMKMQRPYRRDTIDLDMSVTTFRKKS